ncbi:MAG: hypothetical protein KDH20_07760 [Rhodocyclaceae bacterium]|nr:hypothetical protein [Rhodocyclaceae bacterium]
MRPDYRPLSAVGLNAQAILDIDALPEATRERLAAAVDLSPWRRIVLIANTGPELWRAVQAAGVGGAHPIDDFSIDTVGRWWSGHAGGARCLRLYPDGAPIDLQALGRAVGWHHDSPLKIGIHPVWGTWFGYRVALLTDAPWTPTPPEAGDVPCLRCEAPPCRAACPAGAVGADGLDLPACLRFRTQPDSPCARTCLARLACPAGVAYRYDEAQIRHSYGDSLQAIRHFGLPG